MKLSHKYLKYTLLFGIIITLTASIAAGKVFFAQPDEEPAIVFVSFRTDCPSYIIGNRLTNGCKGQAGGHFSIKRGEMISHQLEEGQVIVFSEEETCTDCEDNCAQFVYTVNKSDHRKVVLVPCM